jgi:hypothetical protein
MIRTSEPCGQGMRSVGFEVLFFEDLAASGVLCGRLRGNASCRAAFNSESVGRRPMSH